MATATLDDILAKAYEDEGLTVEDVVGHKGFISTGNLALDFVLGGGIARGRITELYGLSQSGKTTTASQVAAQAMRNQEHVLYVDFEQALDTEYLGTLGVDVHSPYFHPYPAASLEQGMHVASQAIRTGEIALAVFDSVAAMTPRKIVEEDSESRTTAMERARLLGNELSKLNPICARTGCAAVFINHERDVIETGPTRPGMPKRTTTPGGSGLKYYSSQRVQFKIIQQFKGERVDPLTGDKINETHSVLSQALVTKNKLARPMQVAKLYLVLGQGFSNAHAAMMVLVSHKVVKKAGAWFTFPEDLYHPQMSSGQKGPTLQGLAAALDLADFDPEWGEKLAAFARSELKMPATALMPKLVDDPDGPGSPPPDRSDEEDPDEVAVTSADVAPKVDWKKPVAEEAPAPGVEEAAQAIAVALTPEKGWEAEEAPAPAVTASVPVATPAAPAVHAQATPKPPAFKNAVRLVP